jgi:hypothetical protein
MKFLFRLFCWFRRRHEDNPWEPRVYRDTRKCPLCKKRQYRKRETPPLLKIMNGD